MIQVMNSPTTQPRKVKLSNTVFENWFQTQSNPWMDPVNGQLCFDTLAVFSQRFLRLLYSHPAVLQADDTPP